MFTLLRYQLAVLQWLWRIGLQVLLLISMLVLIIAFLWPYLPNYRVQIEQGLSALLNQPVQIEQIETSWNTHSPLLMMKNIRIGKDSERFTIESLKIGLDGLASLQQVRPMTTGIAIALTDLSITRHINGDLSVSGLRITQQREKAPSKLTGILLGWLLQQPQLTVTLARISWSEMTVEPFVLTDCRLNIYKEGLYHQFQSTLNFSNWRSLQNGTTSINGRLTWRNQQVDSIVVETTVGTSIHWNPSPNDLRESPLIVRAHMQLHQPDKQRWQLIIQPLKWQLADWQQTVDKVTVNLPTAQHALAIQAQVKQIQLDDTLLTIVHSLYTALPELPKLQGQLKNVSFTWQNHHWEIYSHLNKISADLPHSHLQIIDLQGRIAATDKSGTLKLQNAKVLFNDSRFYSEPAMLHQVRGQITWQRREKDWMITFPNVKARILEFASRLNGQLNIPIDGTVPNLMLRIHIPTGAVSKIHTLVPDQKLVVTHQWLKQSLLAGNVQNAQVIFSGAVNTLFTRPDGFQLDARVKGGKLRFNPRFPLITSINARIQIAQQRLNVIASQGRIFNSRLTKTVVMMPNLMSKQKQLFINGYLQGDAQEGLRYLRESPLGNSVNLDQFIDLHGKMDLQLELMIPFYPAPHQIKGKLRLLDATLHQKHIDLPLTNVSGELTFDEKSVAAKQIQAQLLEMPVELAIATHREGERKQIQIKINGISHMSSLLAKLPISNSLKMSIAQYVAGSILWQGQLDMLQDKPNSTRITMKLDTNLNGLDILLPPPMNKRPEELRPLQIQLELVPNKSTTRIHIRYANILVSDLEVTQKGLQRGVISFTQSAVQLPDKAELHFLGKIPTLSVSKWRKIVPTTTSTTGVALPLVIDIGVDQLEIADYTFQGIRLHARFSPQKWAMAITGNQLEGQIKFDAIAHPPQLDMAFKRLSLPEQSHAQTPTNAIQSLPDLDPTRLPQISLYCGELTLGKYALGRLTMGTRSDSSGLSADIFWRTTETQAKIQGRWWQVDNQHRTQLYLSWASQQIELLLHRFGFIRSPISDAKGQGQLFLQWADTPYRVSLDKVAASASLSLQDGKLTGIEPGIGRVFGLFDAQALPKRLALDFRDIFSSGFRFEKIDGHFALQNGKLYTEDLQLQASAAKIAITGWTDLAAQQFNQTVTVMPQVSTLIPVISAGILALEKGLIVGATLGSVVLIGQQLLQPHLERTIHFRYRVTGSWSKPQVNALPRAISPMKRTVQ